MSATRFQGPNNDGFAEFALAHPTVLKSLDDIAQAFDMIVQAIRETRVKQRKKLVRSQTLLILTAASYTEFTEISALAMTGFGSGATKLLRALTERITVTLYLMKHPKQVQNFQDYTAINNHKLLVEFDAHIRTKRTDIPRARREAIVREYEAVRHRFVKQPCPKCTEKVKSLCADCRAALKGPLISWTPASIESLAEDVSKRLRKLFFNAYKAPLFFLHPSDWSVDQLTKVDSDGVNVFQHADKERAAAYSALVLSGAMILFLAKGCNRHFKLGLASECDRILEAVGAIQSSLYPRTEKRRS